MPKLSTRLVVSLALILVLASALLSWRVLRRPPQDPGPIRKIDPAPQAGRRPTPANLDQAVRAIAASENADFPAAVELWNLLLQEFPNDNHLLLNQSVTVLKWIEELGAQLSSGSISDEAEIRLRENELGSSIALAERTVATLRMQLEQDHRTQYIVAALWEAKSRRLPPPQDTAMRKQAAVQLAQILNTGTNSPLLACKLDDLAQEFTFDDRDLAQATATSLYSAWQAAPRNLYLLVRSGESFLELQDARLVELLEPSLELAKPMMSMLQPRLAGRVPLDIVASAKSAIQKARWNDAQSLRLWFNVLKSSTAFRPDTRLVKPDIMALLSTQFVQPWRDDLKREPLTSTPSVAEWQFEFTDIDLSTLAGTTKRAIWYDHNVDSKFELLISAGKTVRLYQVPESKTEAARTTPALLQEIAVALEIEGMVAADLFEVDAPGRPKVANSVAELMQQLPRVDATSPAPAAAQVADQANQHDTLQEVIAWGKDGVVLITSQPQSDNPQVRSLAVVAEVPGLSVLKGVSRIVPLDLDSDGDLDLFCVTASGMQVLQNNGNRTFEDISQYSSLPVGDWRPTDVVSADFDRDLDMDLICVSNNRPYVAKLENILHSQLRRIDLAVDAWQDVVPSTRLAIEELDGNGSWDVCLLGSDRVVSGFTRSTSDGQVVTTSINTLEIDSGSHLATADFDNDGFVDVAVASMKGLQIHRGIGGAGFERTGIVVMDNRPVERLEVIDSDQDGSLEILAISNATATVIRQISPTANYVQVRVRGINDVNGGGRINHYSIGSVLELTSAGKYQARIVREPVSQFGLGDETATNLRIVFNNGLTQNLTKVPRNTLVHERQELKGSCPFVYGWDGSEFRLITDLLWNAPLGLQIGRGQVLPDRRWEYLVLPGKYVQPRDNAYELRITEELWEIAYFDHVHLTAVDHPRDFDIYSNEKVGPPDIAQPRLFHSRNKIYPTHARDKIGRDLREKLARRDSNFVQPFDVRHCQGLCEPHFIEMEFEGVEFSKETRLFLTGWLHPTDTSLNIGLDQNPSLGFPEAPSLWVPDASGNFVCVNPFIGFPGGKPKSIVVEIGNPFLCADRRLRIAGSQQIYWDEAFVTATDSNVEMISTPLNMIGADLSYRGFSRLLPKADDQPHWYDYSHTETAPKWPPLEGPMTRYGSVKDLLTQDDDRMVIMSSGDEFVVRFAIPDQPLRDGWVRDFILHCTGWDKDSDVNTIAGSGSLPLPFKTMQAYPPPATQAADQSRVMQLNLPTLIDRNSSANFWIAPRLPTSGQ